MSNEERRTDEEEADADYLEDLPDGSGCFEIWEHLSERRERVACD